ncbi:hypothetical protein ABDM40_30090, partial [Klebsiella pneumoniae]
GPLRTGGRGGFSARSGLLRDWLTLLRQGGALMAAALLQSLPWLAEGDEGLNALLLTLTGGLTLAPTCLVFWHYLTST